MSTPLPFLFSLSQDLVFYHWNYLTSRKEVIKNDGGKNVKLFVSLEMKIR